MSKRRIHLVSCVLVLGLVLTGMAHAGDAILKLDINQTNTPAETEEGFVSFTLADSGSVVEGIKVEFGGTLDSRRRDTPAGIPYEQIYRDFIFSRPGAMTVTLSGLAASTTYEITIYAYDTGSDQLRVADWTANGIFVCKTEFNGSVDRPAAEDDYAFTGRATADDTGTILLESAPGEGTREPSGASHPFAFLNALVVSSSEPLTKARGPSPSDGALHEDTWVNLSWIQGDLAASHDVYLGDNFDDVSNAAPDSALFRGNQTTLFYVAGFPGFAYPEGLVPGTTYYWRIDEVNDLHPDSPWKGDVWSFSIPPKTAYNPDPAEGAEFVDPNATFSWTAGFGAILHTVYLGDNYDDVNDATGGAPQGTTTYTPGPLELEKVYYWRVDEFDAADTHKGDVWTFTTPGAVGSLQPANGAVGVAMTTSLNWAAATNATSHQVYLGLDKETVRNADTGAPEYQGSAALGSESIDPGKLAWHTMYYWRVDAVTNAGTVKGPIWSFTTADFIAVDDFEGYTDDDAAGEAIWQSWIDGFGVPDNGAQVGYLLPPYAEQTIVHGGSQSMPLVYTNEAGVTNSEASLTLTAPRDWTEEGVAELSVWFHGDLANAAEPMHVSVSNAAGAPAVVAHDDSQAVQIRTWQEWVVPLQAFADQGIDLANVDQIAIGLGSKGGAAAGGSGTMYIDDIRLYRP